MKKRLCKKGATREMIMSIGGLLLGIAVIILIIVIVCTILKGFATPEDQATFASYDNLVLKINRMQQNAGEIYLSEDFRIQVSGDYVFVGFNKDEDFAMDGCYPPEKISKPSSCGRHACLCYYKGHYEDFENNKLKRCTPLPGVDYILTLNYASFYYQDPYKDFGVGSKVYKNIVGKKLDISRPGGYPEDDYAYFFAYGHCDAWWVDQNFGNHRIYLEKFYDKSNKKTYIFIAAYTPDMVDLRRNIFKNLVKIIEPKPEEYLQVLMHYCGHREEALWWFDVIYSADKLKGTTYDNELAKPDIKKCVEEAREEKKKIEQLIEKDIEEERKRLPPSSEYHEEEIAMA